MRKELTSMWIWFESLNNNNNNNNNHNKYTLSMIVKALSMTVKSQPKKKNIYKSPFAVSTYRLQISSAQVAEKLVTNNHSKEETFPEEQT